MSTQNPKFRLEFLKVVGLVGQQQSVVGRICRKDGGKKV